MIKKVLIANRGEIAVRIIRTCREMGIDSVAVYSEADRTSLHVRYADEAYCIGPAPASESYLSIDKIIDVAKKSGADAIHPGYGFLSEKAAFADRCLAEGITFIGPSAYAMRTMGDKITARNTMIDAGVPVVPGTKKSFASHDELITTAREIGYPIMAKASAGGGGKGMRLIHSESELIQSVTMAQSEAMAAFGDDTVYLEKYIQNPHHIEFQVLADNYGNTLHLFERECSIQRRHQKIIEETPSPLMTPELRHTMGEMAVMAAKAVNYSGAGTIEFLVDNNLNFYFLEMNTRLQVEHPITERVTGIDLVKQQILVASGQKLAFNQSDIKQVGHAIECRIYAEDPENNFMPSPGKIIHIREPLGLGVRTDGCVYQEYEIPIYYDPMISKLIAWASTRTEAINRMRRALYEYKLSGIKNSIRFLAKVMEHPQFMNGNYDTHFIENHANELKIENSGSVKLEDLSAIAVFFDYMKRLKQPLSTECKNETSNWKRYAKFRNINKL